MNATLSSSRLTIWLGALALAALVLSIPGALRDAGERGGIYLFSWQFLADIPARLTGPGRFRFLLQPAMAILLGVRHGAVDARAGRSSSWAGLQGGRGGRVAALARAVGNLTLMAVLLDVVFQWVILGVAHPVVALLIGPTLIACPYLLARALTVRIALRRGG